MNSYIAFKIKSSSFFEKVVSYFTHSSIVHCEIVTDKKPSMFLGYSSIPFNGVCGRWTAYKQDEWEFIQIDNSKLKKLKDFFAKTNGKKYDYAGCLGIFLKNDINDADKYFCSEWVASVLGIENPQKITPSKLYYKLKAKEV